MKKVPFIQILVLVVTLAACKEDSDPTPLTLGVNVQSSFDQDLVQVFIDGQVKINKRLQTEYSTGVCLSDGMITTAVKEGSHQISVIVNSATSKTETFSINNNFYIGINYDRQTNEISFVYSDRPLAYD